MRLSRFASVLTLLPVGLLPIACGYGPPTVSGSCNAAASFKNSTCSGRCLASITVCPATAQTSGEVQFTATGNYTAAPWTVTPQTARWGACQNSAATTGVTVSSTGLAQCTSGATGTYTVFAFDMTNCNAITVCGGGCTVRGTAQLTCP
jgi:hypothetical protein